MQGPIPQPLRQGAMAQGDGKVTLLAANTLSIRLLYLALSFTKIWKPLLKVVSVVASRTRKLEAGKEGHGGVSSTWRNPLHRIERALVRQRQW